MNHRRSFFTRLMAKSVALATGAKILVAQPAEPAGRQPFLPVVAPDISKLPYKEVDGLKEFHLVAEVVSRELLPGRTITAWGYNGSIPGPMIEVQEGDRVRIVFENHLPEPTAPHWHGLEVPIEMDGVPGLTQDPIMPGGKFVYEFTLNQNGTYFYHSHMPMQQMMGMIGLIIVHPKQPHQPKVDRDFALVLQEWALLPNNKVPNTLAMEFNWLTLNGKTGPATTPLLVKAGERVRIRIVNLGMDHHPIHLHGSQFVVTGSEAGRQPETTWAPGNTVLVGVAQARDVEFVAKYTGDWMLHCHMPHHNMNQMTSMVGPTLGEMGGMNTGAGMAEGMGIIRRGHALADELGPSLGRGLGFGTDRQQPTANTATAPDEHAGHLDAEAKKVVGYPQDMWMVTDEPYKDKPETFGLRPGWTGAMMGMMTLVRVLPPAKFDEISALIARGPRSAQASHLFWGQVQEVSVAAGRLTVSHPRIEGWMDAMTMAYPVDKPEVLKDIKSGDQISATVFNGDMTLHDVKVVRGGGR